MILEALARRLRQAPFVVSCLLAAGLLIGAYSNHFENAFHFDDSHVIVENIFIRSLANAGRFFSDGSTFSSLPENAQYRPLLTLSYALDYRLGDGLDPIQFHRTQFALLVVLGGLLALFYKRLFDLGVESRWNRYLAVYCAAFFCVHTANTETVNYLSSRSSLLATLGVVGAFVTYQLWPGGRRTHLYLLPMIAGGLAKPLAVMFAPLLLVYRLFFEESLGFDAASSANGRRRIRSLFVRWLPVLAASGILFAFVAAMNPDTVVYATVSRWSYALTQPFVWVHYLRLFLLPIGLTADTDWQPVPSWYDTRVFAGALALVAMGVAIYFGSKRRRWRPASFGLAWFALALIPSSSFLPLSEVYNEHRIFFPYVGLTVAVWWAVFQLGWRASRQRGRRQDRPLTARLAWLVIAVLVAHAVGTYQRSKVWQNDETLWRDVVAKSPSNGRGLMNYGLALMKRGQLQEALAQFERARVLVPAYPVLEVNLGIVKSSLGDAEVAEGHFRRALELQPTYALGHFFYGRWLIRQGRAGEALAHLETALALSPAAVKTRSLLASLYSATGDAAALRRLAVETVEIVPTDVTALTYARGGIPFPVAEETAEAYEQLGLSKIDSAAWLDAATVYRRALELEPRSATAWNNLGWARLKLGLYESAAACFERAFELDPTMEVAANNLRWALQLAESGREAG